MGCHYTVGTLYPNLNEGAVFFFTDYRVPHEICHTIKTSFSQVNILSSDTVYCIPITVAQSKPCLCKRPGAKGSHINLSKPRK